MIELETPRSATRADDSAAIISAFSSTLAALPRPLGYYRPAAWRLIGRALSSVLFTCKHAIVLTSSTRTKKPETTLSGLSPTMTGRHRHDRDDRDGVPEGRRRQKHVEPPRGS